MPRATGTFEVKVSPQPSDEALGALGRFAIAKEFSGGLVGTSKGEMIGAGSPQTGSAGYVAMERVTGTLDGREGSFVFQHNGTMKGGVNSLSIQVVPSSGTGGFANLQGTFDIVIEGGKHSYTFDYEIGG